jgi:hypothetical protein
MSDSDFGYFFKYARAVEHYEFICEQARQFIDTNLKLSIDPKRIGTDEWDIATWDDVTEPSPFFGVWLGDFLHNARGALDHLVFFLVMENGGDPGEHSQFPIYDSETKWVEDIEQRNPGRWPKSPVLGLDPEQVAIIKAAQPYHLPHKKRAWHPFTLLLRMSNIDKHRALHAAAVSVASPGTVLYEPPGYVAILEKKLKKPGTIVQQGAEVLRVKRRVIKRPPPDVQVHMRIRGDKAQLVFCEKEGKPIAGVEDLRIIVTEVRRVVEQLDPVRSAAIRTDALPPPPTYDSRPSFWTST